MRTSQRGGRGPAPPAPPPSAGPAPPPSLRAHRYLELDAYLRKLLQTASVKRNHRLLEFLGIAKQGVRYGVRNYEYDSTQSEGNRYIRDDAL